MTAWTFAIVTAVKRFRFLDPGLLIDGALHLVQPSERWIDALLETCLHPLSSSDVAAAGMTRQKALDFLRAAPDGRQPEDAARDLSPAYHFWMRVPPGSDPSIPVEIVGGVSLRVGNSQDLVMYAGHVGYGVYPPARGRHFAERSTRLLFNLARAHGLSQLWITCNPENLASRRTCERLGGELVSVVPLPPENIMYQRGERKKCRYRIVL